MKLTHPLIFTLGVICGALVTIAKLYHDILSKPVLPVLDLDSTYGDANSIDVDWYNTMARARCARLEELEKPTDWRQAYTTFELLEMADEVEDARPVKALSDENIELKWALVDAVTEIERMKKTLADTQPVKVDTTYDMTPAEVADFLEGMEVGAWELEQWTEESE